MDQITLWILRESKLISCHGCISFQILVAPAVTVGVSAGMNCEQFRQKSACEPAIYVKNEAIRAGF